MNLATSLILAVGFGCIQVYSIDPRICRQQKTCGQCQATSPDCTWCSAENYSWDRCDRADYQRRSGCQTRYIVNQTSVLDIERNRPIGGRVLISPQYLEARLHKGRPASIPVRVKVTDKDVRRRGISLRPRTVPGVTVTVSSNCPGFRAATKNCPRVRLGQTVEFTLTLAVTRCQGRQRLRIGSPGTRGRTIRIDITTSCVCNCESEAVTDDARCSGNGRFSCGTCQCYRGWSGPVCECEAEAGDPNAACMAQNGTHVCSGRGQCVCGECRCDSQIRNPYYGRYCECNDHVCSFHEGQLCGGPERGRCVCGQCLCNNGYRGEACNLSTDRSSCTARNGLICNNNGLCLGGVCRCDGLFRGPTCEECPTCQGRCSELKHCVLCHAFQSGPLSRQDCITQCSYMNMNIVDTLNPSEVGMRACSFVDDTDGSFYFFSYRNTDPILVRIQRNKVFAGR